MSVRAVPLLCCLLAWPLFLHGGCFWQQLLEDPGETEGAARPRLRQRVCASFAVRSLALCTCLLKAEDLFHVVSQRQTLQSLHAGSEPTQGMSTGNIAGGSTRIADRSQAALPPPSLRGRSTGPAMAGASQLAAERRQQGPQGFAVSRSPRTGLAPSPTPTPSRASSTESGSVFDGSSLAGNAEGGTPDVDPQELSHALEQATESSSSAAAAAESETGQPSHAGCPLAQLQAIKHSPDATSVSSVHHCSSWLSTELTSPAQVPAGSVKAQ